MRPEVIFINMKDNMVIMSKEDVERLIDRVYEAGKNDASQYASARPSMLNPTTGEIDAWIKTSTARRAEGTTITTMTR